MAATGADDRSAQFWVWFQANSDRLLGQEPGSEGWLAVFREVLAEVDRVTPGLVAEVGTEGPPYEFVVSADGSRELFPAVERLVATAPLMPNWRVIAFRPPHDAARISFNGMVLDRSDLWFQIRGMAEDQKRLDVVMCARGLTEGNADAMAPAMFLLMDAALGEYAAVTQVKVLGVGPCPENPEAHNFVSTEGLKGLLDAILHA